MAVKKVEAKKDLRKRVTKHEETNNLLGFLSKMQIFEYTPPSDNLWTISISQETYPELNGKKVSLTSLFETICAINSQYKKHIGTKWAINTESVANQEEREQNYIKMFQEKDGIYLAQNISFTPMTNNILDNPWTIGSSEHAGFLNFGLLSMGRQDPKSLKVSFLVSNWDIGDLLFDRWIAAVAQHGLLESGDTSIKAKITITEYSAGVDEKYRSDKEKIGMRERKQYIFHNCIPTSRGEVSKTYEQSEAGTFKKFIVDFRYEDYQINYLF